MTGPGHGAQAALLGIAAAIVVAVTIQAGGPSLNDPDSAASVLYFRHIATGDRLVTFVSTTPKPFLTVVYGIAWSLTGDWRVLGWLTIAAFGVAVACGAELLRRLAGLPAAAFLVVAMTLSPVLVVEVSRANSLVWAVAAWLVAGLALFRPQPRVWVAAFALLAAFLCRTETLVLVLPATAWIAVLAARGRFGDARRFAPLLLAWLAIPIAGLHDLALTGDPLYWLSVPAGYTAIVAPDFQPIGPIALLGETIARFAGMPLLVALGIVGTIRLAVLRNWAAVVAIVGLTAGVAALLLAVAWRHVFVTTRYLEHADVAVILAAAVGAGWLADVAGREIAGRIRHRRPASTTARAIALVFGLAAALAIGIPPAPLDNGLAAELERVRTASRNADVVVPELRAILVDAPGEPAPPVIGPAGLAVVDPRSATLLVPRSLLNRLLVDLDAPLTRLGDSWLAIRREGALESIAPGQVIYHDRAGDGRPALFGPLEAQPPIDGAAITLEPRFVDAIAGIWILEATAR